MAKIVATSVDMDSSFSELVLLELDYRYSREEVTLAATATDLAFGTVLMRKSDGTYTPLTETSGTLGDPKAVLIKAVSSNVSTQTAAVIRRSAVLNGAALVFDSSVTKKAEAKLALSDLGIVIKE